MNPYIKNLIKATVTTGILLLVHKRDFTIANFMIFGVAALFAVSQIEQMSISYIKKYIYLAAFLVFWVLIGFAPTDKALNFWFQREENNYGTFYYKKDEEREVITLIEKSKEKFEKMATLFFPNELAESKIVVYLQNYEEAKKDNNFKNNTSVGYYNNGVIKLRLDRAELYNDKGEVVQIFAKPDPVKSFYHEYTHHLIRVITSNEVPGWFDEGLAEYMANSLDGADSKIRSPLPFEIIEDKNNWDKYYDVYESNEFYVKKIINTWGEIAIMDLLKNMSDGDEFEKAIEKAIGISYEALVFRLKE